MVFTHKMELFLGFFKLGRDSIFNIGTSHFQPQSTWPLGNISSFHMASYLFDMMCLVHAYLEMGWAWQPTKLPIHVYYKVLWEHKYHTEYQKICEKFLIPIF
jgi:hypothetical protein